MKHESVIAEMFPDPICRHFGRCGGCDWQHIAYPEQLRLKQRTLQALLNAALGSHAPKVRSTIAAGPPGAASRQPGEHAPPDGAAPAGAAPVSPWAYRNKVHFAFGPGERGQGLVMGHYARGSRAVIPVEECPVHAGAGNELAFALRDALRRAHVPGSTPDGDRGVARHLVVRVGENTGDLLATLVVTENTKALRRVTADLQAWAADVTTRHPDLRIGFHLNVHDRPGSFLFGPTTRRLFGESAARERVAGVSYLIPPTAFFQTNVRAAEVLVRQVLSALSDHRLGRILDLYAGTGLFALPLAVQGRSVTAVEESREAIEQAATALRLNRVAAGRCRLIASRVEAAMQRLATSGRRREWDAVVLDPPRQGCPPRVLDWIFRILMPARVVYVSCNPEALAGDLRSATAAGYAIDSVTPVDMFPHTEHIESVAVLSRRRCGRTPTSRR